MSRIAGTAGGKAFASVAEAGGGDHEARGVSADEVFAGVRRCLSSALDVPEESIRLEHKIVEDYVTWVAAKRKQYGEAGGYMPPLLPQYYFASLDNFLRGAREALDTAANPPDAMP